MKKIYDISKSPAKNIDMMIIGLLQIAEGLLRFFSLGCVDNINLEMKYLVWRTMKQIKNNEKK